MFAALLLHQLGEEITEDNIENVIKSAGLTPNVLMVKALVYFLDHQVDGFIKRKLARLRKKLFNARTGGTRIAITIDGELNAKLINATRRTGTTKRGYVKEALIRQLIDKEGHPKGPLSRRYLG